MPLRLAANHQIVKCRDDKDPVILKPAEVPTDAEPFEVAEGSKCSWCSPENKVGPSQLRRRIEPWLTSLFQSEHLATLFGSGLTHAVHWMATQTGLPGMGKNAEKFAEFEDAIAQAAGKSAKVAGRSTGNIEDRLRAANELLRGVEILSTSNSALDQKASSLRESISNTLKEFADSILLGERGLRTADPTKREEAFNYLVSFLMSFAGRTGTRDRLQIFTTNYDRYIEAGADASGLHLLDRFVGSLSPIFRASRLEIDVHYNPPGIRGEPRYLEGVARFTKLHGSLDWFYYDKTIRRASVPFGADEIDPFLKNTDKDGCDANQLMIYPNSAKDRETAAYPYVDLFRDFAAGVCRPNNTLVTYGYSFGDEHINRVIDDMLTIPSTHLVVISYNDPLDRIMKSYEQFGRPAQITLLLGDHLGDLKSLVNSYLPKPAIDRTTFRMAELLKARWTEHQQTSTEGQSGKQTVEAP
jgi:hypothetical protein